MFDSPPSDYGDVTCAETCRGITSQLPRSIQKSFPGKILQIKENLEPFSRKSQKNGGGGISYFTHIGLTYFEWQLVLDHPFWDFIHTDTHKICISGEHTRYSYISKLTLVF